MLSFECDYAEGAHEAVLQHLLETNLEQLPGYGQDRYCDAAKEKIRSACGCGDADVFFISGGTTAAFNVYTCMAFAGVWGAGKSPCSRADACTCSSPHFFMAVNISSRASSAFSAPGSPGCFL